MHYFCFVFSELKAEEIAGIAIAVLIVVIFLGAVVFCICRYVPHLLFSALLVGAQGYQRFHRHGGLVVKASAS